jgi:hypothetical protein
MRKILKNGMKTAEEILESHLTSMLSRTKESYVTIDEMKQIPEWEVCVNAIEQAQKEAYNQALQDTVEKAEVIEIEITPPKPYDQRPYTKYLVNKESILKLKK